MLHTSASDDGATRSKRRALEQLAYAIKILEHERDQLIPLVTYGPLHLRSLRLRQLKSIQRQLTAVRAEEAQFSGPFVH